MGSALRRAHLGDDPSGDLRTTHILHDNGGPNRQLTIQLDGSSVSIQIGCSCRHRELKLMTILARQPYGSTQAYPTATALRDLIAIYDSGY